MAVRNVEKKSWPQYFKSLASGKRKAEIRLADFAVSPRDKMVLKEYDPKTQRYSGRKKMLKVRSVTKIGISEIYSAEEMAKNGLYLIEF